MVGGVGHTGGLKKPAPGAEDAKPVILIPVGLPCLERGRLIKKIAPLRSEIFESKIVSLQPGKYLESERQTDRQPLDAVQFFRDSFPFPWCCIS